MQLEEDVPVLRRVRRVLDSLARAAQPRLDDPLGGPNDPELYIPAVLVLDSAVEHIPAPAFKVAALGRGRLHEHEQVASCHDRRQGMDLRCAGLSHRREVCDS